MSGLKGTQSKYNYVSELVFCAKPIMQIAVHLDRFSCPSAPHLHRLCDFLKPYKATISLEYSIRELGSSSGSISKLEESS